MTSISMSMRKANYSAANRRGTGEQLVSGKQADFLVKTGMRDASNYTNIKIQDATLWNITSARPTPWYNRNPIAQGVHETGGSWTGPKQTPTDRQGNNQL